MSRFSILCVVCACLLPMIGALAASGGAHDERVYSVRIGRSTAELLDSRDRHLILSRRCLRASGTIACDAYSMLTRATLKPVPGESPARQDAEPGSVVCMRAGGHFVIGLDARQNQLGLCQFADGTLVSGGTLYYYAHLNDSRR